MQEYLELSSFVHGGPTSSEIFAAELKKDEFKEINSFLIYSFFKNMQSSKILCN